MLYIYFSAINYIDPLNPCDVCVYAHVHAWSVLELESEVC